MLSQRAVLAYEPSKQGEWAPLLTNVHLSFQDKGTTKEATPRSQLALD